MAEHDNVRLAAACHCGKPARVNLGRGPKPKTCEDHSRPIRPQLEKKECPACRGFFTPVKREQSYCTRECGRRTRRGSKPRQMWKHSCKHCGDAFESIAEEADYCASRCKLAAWKLKNLERVRAHRLAAPPRINPPKLLCAYFTGHCEMCGCAWGGRAKRVNCKSCQSLIRKKAACDAAKIVSLARHRAQGKVVRCSECTAGFCPLYGASHCTLCDVCAKARFRESQKVGKKRRNARIRGASVGEPVHRLKVFARDGWLCQLCGIQTPRELMGSMAQNAPELDHINPVSRGGAHSTENTQCLCRSCNGWKSDRTMAEVVALLEGGHHKFTAFHQHTDLFTQQT